MNRERLWKMYWSEGEFNMKKESRIYINRR